MSKKPSFTNRAGRWISQGGGNSRFQAFVPNPLPPDPPVVFTEALADALQDASLALGRLDGIGRLLPRPEDLLYSYVRKEAVLSSQIEGTQSSITDLLLHENATTPGVSVEDVEEVSNYVRALQHGIKLLDTLPVSLRLIREVHGVLVTGTRGHHYDPGEFRRSQNWIGGSKPGDAAFVPPPVSELMRVLDHLEKFIHSTETPVLLKVGMVHAQFETIHPFLDGNGRVGRMLIPLLLVSEGILTKPWLYVSLHFKRQRARYYELLQRVRTHGDWETWLLFYLRGLADISNEAFAKINHLLDLFQRDAQKVASSRSGSIYQQAAAQSNLSVYQVLQHKLAVRIPEAASLSGTSKPTAKRALEELVVLGIAEEVTERKRGKLYVYRAYLDTLNRDD